MVSNTYYELSNYAAPGELQKILVSYAEEGYSLVSTILAKNKYGVEVMYLFFTKKD